MRKRMEQEQPYMNLSAVRSKEEYALLEDPQEAE